MSRNNINFLCCTTKFFIPWYFFVLKFIFIENETEMENRKTWTFLSLSHKRKPFTSPLFLSFLLAAKCKNLSSSNVIAWEWSIVRTLGVKWRKHVRFMNHNGAVVPIIRKCGGTFVSCLLIAGLKENSSQSRTGLIENLATVLLAYRNITNLWSKGIYECTHWGNSSCTAVTRQPIETKRLLCSRFCHPNDDNKVELQWTSSSSSRVK